MLGGTSAAHDPPGMLPWVAQASAAGDPDTVAMRLL